MKTKLCLLLLFIFLSCNQGKSNNNDDTSFFLATREKVWKKANKSNNFRHLTEGEKTFVYVEMLELEINNGGFYQFFFNLSGDYCEESLKAYRTIGAYKTAKIIEEAYKYFPANPIPKDPDRRQLILEEVSPETSKKWEQLGEQFYKYEENIEGLLIEYVKKNQSEFK